MAEMKAQYLGGLQVECEHLKSGAKLKTSPQAGQPEAGATFSPTGLCASALAACVLTMMGAYAEKNGLDIQGAEVEISLSMAEEPHRIGSITSPRKRLYSIGNRMPDCKTSRQLNWRDVL